MRWIRGLGTMLVPVVIPVIGIGVAVSVPLLRSAQRHSDERTAITVLQRVIQAQDALHHRTGAYAADARTLLAPCRGEAAVLSDAFFDELRRAGYVLDLRPAMDASWPGVECNGHALVDGYQASVAPVSASVAGRQAFAAGREGQIYLFHDGVAPREVDIASGLATPLEQRETFKIP